MARKRRTPEECVRILREAAKHGIAETVKKNNITETTFYRWRRMYGGMEISEIQRIRQLEKENEKLKRLAGDQALVIQTFKEELKKKAGRRLPEGYGLDSDKAKVIAAALVRPITG